MIRRTTLYPRMSACTIRLDTTKAVPFILPCIHGARVGGLSYVSKGGGAGWGRRVGGLRRAARSTAGRRRAGTGQAPAQISASSASARGGAGDWCCWATAPGPARGSPGRGGSRAGVGVVSHIAEQARGKRRESAQFPQLGALVLEPDPRYLCGAQLDDLASGRVQSSVGTVEELLP